MIIPNISPIGNRILVQAIDDRKPNSKQPNIIIPETAAEKSMESVVVAVGLGQTNDHGTVIPMEVKKGDRVLVAKYRGMEVKVEGQAYTILTSNDILAVMT